MRGPPRQIHHLFDTVVILNVIVGGTGDNAILYLAKHIAYNIGLGLRPGKGSMVRCLTGNHMLRNKRQIRPLPKVVGVELTVVILRKCSQVASLNRRNIRSAGQAKTNVAFGVIICEGICAGSQQIKEQKLSLISGTLHFSDHKSAGAAKRKRICTERMNQGDEATAINLLYCDGCEKISHVASA
jgi:hypothetical protein